MTDILLDLSGRRALVTGAGQGIGAGIALHLARAGADVVVHYRASAKPATEVVASIEALGRRAIAVQADLIDPAAAARVVSEAASFLGGLDIVVNNAGNLLGRVEVAGMSDQFWRDVLEVNLSSAFLVTRAAVPLLAASTAGRIIMMSSLASENGGGQGAVAYATSKAAVNGFTQSLAKELAKHRVTVNAVAPGFIEGTPFHATFTAADARPGIIAGIPLGRAGTVDDVAGVVAFLASDLAGFMTGQVIDINGGTNFR